MIFTIIDRAGRGEHKPEWKCPYDVMDYICRFQSHRSEFFPEKLILDGKIIVENGLYQLALRWNGSRVAREKEFIKQSNKEAELYLLGDA